MSDSVQTQSLPRTVLVASDDLYVNLMQDSESVELLQDRVALIVPISREPEIDAAYVTEARTRIAAANQLVAGSLLIKNPYDPESYEFAEDALETFASAKHFVLANVARLLGARRVHVKETVIDTGSTSWAADLAAQLQVGAIDGNVTRDVKRRLERQIDGDLKFPGSPSAPEEALSYLVSRNLERDHQLRNLIELRTGPANLVSSYMMNMSGTRESESNFRSALRIANAGPIKAAEIGSSFTRTAQTIREVKILTEITF